MDQPTVVIDFDGTICEHRYPEVGPPMPGAREALTRLKAMGFRIIIHSVRTASYWRTLAMEDPRVDPVRQVNLIQDYMAKQRLPYDEICLADKPVAVAYIDDRAYRFENNWVELAERIERERQTDIINNLMEQAE